MKALKLPLKLAPRLENSTGRQNMNMLISFEDFV